MHWTLAKARDNLSDVVRRAVSEGPQPITVRGAETVVVVSKATYDQLLDPDRPRSIKDWLLDGPVHDFDIERRQDPRRDVDL